MHLIDLTGHRIHRLVVLSRAPSRKKVTYWNCRCDCGKDIIVSAGNLKKVHSCGCHRNEIIGKLRFKHGRRHTVEYQAWLNARNRCFNPKNKSFHDYGGRGITMDPTWSKDFNAFFKEVGLRPHGTTLDRIDNAKGYIPGNVRWANSLQQAHNRRPYPKHQRKRIIGPKPPSS